MNPGFFHLKRQIRTLDPTLGLHPFLGAQIFQGMGFPCVASLPPHRCCRSWRGVEAVISQAKMALEDPKRGKPEPERSAQLCF